MKGLRRLRSACAKETRLDEEQQKLLTGLRRFQHAQGKKGRVLKVKIECPKDAGLSKSSADRVLIEWSGLRSSL